MNRTMNLTTEPIPFLVRSLAIPASIGFFFNTMFNVVDTYFAGLVSTQALAALSLSFPVFFIVLAIGSGVSTGTTALIATSLGAGDTVQARTMATQGVVFGVLLSAVLTAFGLSASPWLFSLLGATGDYLDMCLQYMNTIFWGSGLFVLNHMLNAVLNAQGDTVSFRNFLIASFFLNCLLDPWFMYGWLGFPALGIQGIALATVAIQFLGCAYLGWRVSLTELMCVDCLEEVVPNPRAFRSIIRQGLPTSLNFATVGLGVFVITYFIGTYGREAVAAYGVATRVEQIMLLPTIGLNIATVTIVAQNNGAQRFERIFETVRTALVYGGAFMAGAGFLLFVTAPRLMRLFTADEAVVSIGSSYLRIAAFVLYSYVILYVSVAALQGVKRPGYGLLIGVLRQIALPIVVFPVLSGWMALGLAGVWWGIFSITWTAALLTLFYARAHLKALGRSRPQEPPMD